MPDILHDLFIRANPKTVFDTVSTPEGLDAWWTKHSSGIPAVGERFELWFAPEYVWRGKVTNSTPVSLFELEITEASEDWIGTHVRFDLEERGEGTTVRFAHLGWKETSEHFRVSSYCWATYLRILKRFIEHGERVAYEDRDNA